jgi:DNA repair protein RecN (Recombination protein N)
MLLALSIRDIVLIDRLDLSFHSGLCVMTGETGAGKSILLDALGLALGERGDTGLIRQGCKQALVSAEFDLAGNGNLAAMLEEQALPVDDRVVLRRSLSADGRSRAFINDQPVSAALLRTFGDELAEIQGQREGAGLRQSSTHRTLVDAFGGAQADLAKVGRAYHTRQAAEESLRVGQAEADKVQAEEDYLRFALEEFEGLAPEEGEEAELAQEREMLRHGEQLREALLEATEAINDNGGIESRLHLAGRHVGRAARHAGGRLDEVLAALERASAEAADAIALLDAAIREAAPDPQKLNTVEERLFALRALARKHQTTVDDLPRIWSDIAGKLQGIDEGGARLQDLVVAAEEARAAYDSAAETLTKVRRRAATKLDKAVTRELAPLKLGKARLRTRVDTEGAGGPEGRDTVLFEAATNEGQAFAPLARVASGGELSRFLLALRVVLAGKGGGKTLIFDEADSGVGGATADAVGERLSQLAAKGQVLAVTHSPQVAARGDHHWRILKADAGNGKRGVLARTEELSPDGRQEEVARMLAGAEITEEARAAARRLIERAPAREELPA